MDAPAWRDRARMLARPNLAYSRSGAALNWSQEVTLTPLRSSVPQSASIETQLPSALELSLRSRNSFTSPPAALPWRTNLTPFEITSVASKNQMRATGSTRHHGAPGNAALMSDNVTDPPFST